LCNHPYTPLYRIDYIQGGPKSKPLPNYDQIVLKPRQLA